MTQWRPNDPGRFAGHLKSIGPVPLDPFGDLRDRVISSVGEWPQAGPMFTQAIEGLDNIALMFPVNYPASHLNSRPTEHWGYWQDCVSPLIDFVAARLRLGVYEPAKVILSRLRAGAAITEHVDLNPSSQVPHKVHIPIVTSPLVTFTVEDGEYHLEPGQAYELNNLRRHAVYNRGEVDRIHLIIEVYSTAASSHPAQ